MLQDTDRQTREDVGWRWHAMNVLIFCTIHFGRTVNRLIPESQNVHEERANKEIRRRLLALPHCTTREDYAEIIEAVKGKFESYLLVSYQLLTSIN